MKAAGAGFDCPVAWGVVVLPEAATTPATPGTGTAVAGVAVVPASLAAGVPAARPTLVPEVAKCIGVTASWVENNEVVVQPGAMAPVVATWTWPSEIWLTRPAATEHGTETVTETGIVVVAPLADGADVGRGLPAIGVVVVVVWPASTGALGAGVTGPAESATTTELLATGVDTGVGISSTDLVTITRC